MFEDDARRKIEELYPAHETVLPNGAVLDFNTPNRETAGEFLDWIIDRIVKDCTSCGTPILTDEPDTPICTGCAFEAGRDASPGSKRKKKK